jgi:hypothetical protein
MPHLLLATLAAALVLVAALVALWVPQATPLAAAGILPLFADRLWRGRPRFVTATAATCCVLGLALAGTSRAEFSRAATELLARWPGIAGLPWMGTAAVAAGLALLLATERGARPAPD